LKKRGAEKNERTHARYSGGGYAYEKGERGKGRKCYGVMNAKGG